MGWTYELGFGPNRQGTKNRKNRPIFRLSAGVEKKKPWKNLLKKFRRKIADFSKKTEKFRHFPEKIEFFPKKSDFFRNLG